MTSWHYKNERQSRNELIHKIGIGKPVDRFYIDRGHADGAEIHVITSTALILIYNQHTHRFVTALIARPAQIERYCVGKFPTIKLVDEYILSHTEHKYLMMDKPFVKKIKYNCIGGKEIY